MARFERTDLQTFNRLGQERPLKSHQDKDWFRQELARAGLTNGGGEEQIIAVLEWTMNQVKKAAVAYPESPCEALQLARDGAGLSCGPMSDIFSEALNSLGFHVREIQLVRSLLDDVDTHVTIEVLLDGRWVIFDPTFNVSYSKNGTLIGIQEIRASLLNGTASDIKPVFYGEVAYPGRLETYYVDWLPLFNNILILHQGSPSLLAKLPPMRYWFGPQAYYVTRAQHGLWMVELGKMLYFVFVAVLPIIAGILIFLTILLWLSIRRKPSEVDAFSINLDTVHQGGRAELKMPFSRTWMDKRSASTNQRGNEKGP